MKGKTEGKHLISWMFATTKIDGDDWFGIYSH